MRSFHRDIGFFMIGLTIVYTLSGILLVFRDTDLMKSASIQKRELKPGIVPTQLGDVLRIRDLKVTSEEGDIIFFQGGTYNKVTGIAEINTKVLIFPFNKFIDLHKTISKKATHYFTVSFAFLLLFMAISSFWMFRPNNRNFKRGVILATAGILSVIILLIIS
jgi:hypothetical protein